MIKLTKSSAGLVARFGELVPSDPRVERKQMFGYPAAFLGGNLMMSLFQESVVLRLGDEDRAAFLKQAGAKTFEPMKGRPMKEYVIVPATLVKDDKAMSRWVARAVAHAAALPAKAKKKPAATKRPKKR
jgi:TfoX/Sxy family transcriptional regulator of competence genes